MSKIKRFAPLFLVLFVNIICFGVLFFSSSGIDLKSLYYSMALMGVVLVSYAVILFFSLGDEYLFLIVSMLLTIGIIMLFRLNPDSAVRQIIWFYVGMGGFYLVYIAYRSINIWHKIPFVYVGASVILFLITIITAKSVFGAKNWISIGGISVQPSEVIKIFFILALSAMYTQPYNTQAKNRFLRFYNSEKGRQLVIMAVVYLNIGFLILQREWGLALLYFLIYFVMQYVFGKGLAIIALNVALSGICGFAGVKLMSHIAQRIAIWIDPFENAGDMGYQIVQSLYAMASGGFTGTGLTLGNPQLVPVVKSDFIFAAICEEFGMLGGIAVIMLFFILVYRGIKLSLCVTNPFNKAVALGISIMFGFQTFIIVGGVTKLVPLTGITLPFMSAGGSSLSTSFAALAILQAISAKTEEISYDI